MATVVKVLGVEQGNAILELDCGHFSVVPVEDEQALSFVGAETGCDRHRLTRPITNEEANAILERWTVLLDSDLDRKQVEYLTWVAACHATGYGAYSEYTTREERCRNLNLS